MYCSMSRLWRAFSLWPLTFSFPFLPLSFSTDSLPAAIGLLFMLFIHSLFSTLMSVSEPQISLDKSKSMEQNVQTVSIGTHTHTHTTSNALCVDANWRDFRRWQLRKAQKRVRECTKTELYGFIFNDWQTTAVSFKTLQSQFNSWRKYKKTELRYKNKERNNREREGGREREREKQKEK